MPLIGSGKRRRSKPNSNHEAWDFCVMQFVAVMNVL